MYRISADNLVIEFPIYGASSRSLKNTVIRAATGGTLAADARNHVIARALDHVSFEWREGDRIGLVGHNGSGKTTLLRVIAGIYEPVGGSITVQGKVASMLSISLGMDSEATGYENIHLRGLIMGLRPRQIRSLIDDVCDFADLGAYIDMPMRTYSSGMMMRLAFAISTSVAADIILMDEWLSAGDEAFAAKCHDRLSQLVGQARILVLASHDQNIIRLNCNKLVRLEHGHIIETAELSGRGAEVDVPAQSAL